MPGKEDAAWSRIVGERDGDVQASLARGEGSGIRGGPSINVDEDSGGRPSYVLGHLSSACSRLNSLCARSCATLPYAQLHS